jgi:hypothetical protein
MEAEFVSLDLDISWDVLGDLRESDIDALITEKALTAVKRAKLISLWKRHPKMQAGKNILFYLH